MTGLIIEKMIRRTTGVSIFLIFSAIIAAIILTVADEQIIVFGYTALLSITIPTYGLLLNVQDHGNNWCKYEQVLPISKRSIILSKFACYLIDVAIAFVIASIFSLIAYFVNASIYDLGLIDALSLLTMLFAFVSFIGGFFYGGVYMIGVGKSDIWFFISLLLAVVSTVLMAFLLHRSGVGQVPGLFIMMGIALLVLILAYVLSVYFYSKDRD